MKITPMGNIQTDLDKRHLTIDEVETSILYGGEYKTPAPYDENVVYKAGECISYTDENGVVLTLIAKRNGIFGTFDLTDWEVCNILKSQYKMAANINNFGVAQLLGL